MPTWIYSGGPSADQLWVKTWDPTDAEITARPRKRILSRWSDHAGTRALDASLHALDVFPRLTPAFCRAAFLRDTLPTGAGGGHRRSDPLSARDRDRYHGLRRDRLQPDPTFDERPMGDTPVMEMTKAYAARGEYPMNVTLNVRFIGKSDVLALARLRRQGWAYLLHRDPQQRQEPRVGAVFG